MVLVFGHDKDTKSLSRGSRHFGVKIALQCEQGHQITICVLFVEFLASLFAVLSVLLTYANRETLGSNPHFVNLITDTKRFP